MDRVENVGYRIGFYVQQAAIPVANGALASLVIKSLTLWELELVAGAIEVIYELSKEILNNIPALSEQIRKCNLSAYQIRWLNAIGYLICGLAVCSGATLLGVRSIETSVALLLTLAAAVGRLANQKLMEKQSCLHNPESEENKRIKAKTKVKNEKKEELIKQKETDLLQREMTLKVAVKHLEEGEEKTNKLLHEAEEKHVVLETEKKDLEREKAIFAQSIRRAIIQGARA